MRTARARKNNKYNIGPVINFYLKKNYRDSIESLGNLQKTIIEDIHNKKYKTAITKLYEIERELYSSNINSPAVKMYNNYLIVLTYYKAKKYDKCLQAIEKCLACNTSKEEMTANILEYIYNIRYLRGRVFFIKGQYYTAIKILTDITQEFESKYGQYGAEDNKNFGYESLLNAVSCTGECYMVFQNN